MRRLKRIFKFLGYTLLVIIGLLVCGFIYLVIVSKTNPPEIADRTCEQLQRTDAGGGLYTIGNNWFRKSNSGLYEMYVEGDAFERGVINGKLSQELVQGQEDAFNGQINKMIPSRFYQHFLKYVIGWFNRDLADNVTEEYKEEIYGVSLSASDKYNYIGSNYQRILNYHAAHDIGHALQSMALVGCTSFGTWGAVSQDSTMIIGRNFDFYVGDEFAKNKMVAFINPKQGYKFMMVTWGGFVGVVSGMNEKGLSVTINADRTDIPSGSATPVSLVAREILQYASNINEAYAIAAKRKMFVAESFLIGSAIDKKAVVIEKTPTGLGMYDPQTNFILCANHFQSDSLKNTPQNKLQEQQSASVYRYNRLAELLQQNGVNTVQKTAAILRDRMGLQNADIGMGNEKAINQLIAHHSVIFEPERKLVWVSTAPWQLGEYVCYDLNKIFSLHGISQSKELYDSTLTIPAASFLLWKDYRSFVKYSEYKHAIADGGKIDNVDSLIATNPQYYHTYVLAGDYLFRQHQYDSAINYYKLALTKEIATVPERERITKQIQACERK